MSAQVQVKTAKALRLMSGEWLGYVYCGDCCGLKASQGAAVRVADVGRLDGSGEPLLVDSDQRCDCCGLAAADWPREAVTGQVVVEYVACRIF